MQSMKVIQWRTLVGLVLVGLGAHAARAEMVSKTVDYQADGVQMQGYLAYDDAQVSADNPAPGVLVIHEWWGLNDYPKMRARQLARMGYVAFCADMYGQGRSTDNPKQAGKWSSKVYQNRDQARARARKALQVLSSQKQVNDNKLAAIGFCFGGTTVMELAYDGAPVKAVVSFHGVPKPPRTGEAKQIQAGVLFLHGDADPYLPDSTLDKITKALSQAGVDWHLVMFGGAKHAFTNPKADSYGMKPVGYDKKAAKRAWRHMQMYFDEVFGDQSES